jgi:hypothetical protein
LQPGPLPVADIVTKAVALAWKRRKALTTLLIPVTLALTALDLVVFYLRTGHDLRALLESLTLYMLWFPAWAIFAVACHRFVLLEDGVIHLGQTSVLFPAAAIDERPDTDWALRITKGNGLRILVVLCILFVPSKALHFFGGEVAQLSYAGSFLLRFIGNLFDAVGLVGLSLIFRYLSDRPTGQFDMGAAGGAT